MNRADYSAAKLLNKDEARRIAAKYRKVAGAFSSPLKSPAPCPTWG
jgi:hypothetical protein